MGGVRPVREWVRADHSTTGPTTVTVTLYDGHITARWTVKAYNRVTDAVIEARTHATKTLNEMKEAA